MSDYNNNQSNIRRAVGGLLIGGAASLIALFEGFSENAYLPTKNDVPTIGYGQTTHLDGKPVKMGEKITKREALNNLMVITERASVKISRCIKVPLKQNEFNAYLSLAYNIGETAFCKSTLVKKLNTKDYAGACKEILRWKYQKGKVLRGLEIRRKKEYEECIK